ncbi:MAG TPA: glycosyltransferase family A protein [candidate division Zixibacteria bacterium]|nr:glycosyltransferase family A protein [candidate division Zixibacteria bacterium]
MNRLNDPLVSVVIPTYNRWPMVREAVESVLAQSFRDFELIVVDDGSTDGTAERLASVRGVTVLRRSRGGPAAARNAGVARSRGKYVAFLDSDDLWLPRKLELQTAYLEAAPEREICQSEEIWLRCGVRVNPKARHRKPSGDIFRRSLDLCLVSPSAVMMTRELFDRMGGFDESFPVCEDYELWLRIGARYPVWLLEEPLVVKRGGHADQLSRSVWGMDRFRVAALAKLLRSGIEGERRRWVAEALERKAAIVAQGARKRGRLAEAAGYEALAAGALEEIGDVGRTDSGARDGAGISPAHSEPLARLAGAR